MEFFSTTAQTSQMKRLLGKLIERQSHPNKVGPRVTALREALNLTKADFADSIELDRSSLTKIEQGKAGLDIAVAERITALYGCGLDFIYRGEFSDLPRDLHAIVVQTLANQRT